MEKREYLHTDCENVMVWPLWSYIAKDYFKKRNTISSVEFSHSVVSNFLWPHGLQNARLPCPSPIPRVFSNSCASSWWCHPNMSSSVPLLLSPLIFPSTKAFWNESALHIRWPKYQSFSFSISPSSEYSRLVYVRIDWFDLLAVKGILKSRLQQYGTKASILWRSIFFIVQQVVHVNNKCDVT